MIDTSFESQAMFVGVILCILLSFVLSKLKEIKIQNTVIAECAIKQVQIMEYHFEVSENEDGDYYHDPMRALPDGIFSDKDGNPLKNP